MYARALMNGWDWRLNNKNDALNLKSQIKNNIIFRMKEDRIRERVSQRTKAEKRTLMIRRTITMLLSFIVIIAGWTGIISISISADKITKYVSKVSIFWGNWTPTVVITVVNFVIPKFL